MPSGYFRFSRSFSRKLNGKPFCLMFFLRKPTNKLYPNKSEKFCGACFLKGNTSDAVNDNFLSAVFVGECIFFSVLGEGKNTVCFLGIVPGGRRGWFSSWSSRVFWNVFLCVSKNETDYIFKYSTDGFALSTRKYSQNISFFIC